jgi:hypothetical protein
MVKTMERYVIPTLDSWVTTTTYFDLWMSKSKHDMFVLVINFINSLWVPYYVIVGLFKSTNTFGVVMVAQVKDLMSLYNLLDKLIVYVKDEGGNTSTFA